MKIKFLCLNIFRGGVFFEQINKFLKKENPDILSLQEVYNGEDKKLPKRFRSIQLLKKNFPDYHYHFAPEMIVNTPHGKIEQGNAIFSRFPIKKTKTVFFDIPYKEVEYDSGRKDYFNDPKNLHLVKLENGLNIVNLHGIWGTDGQDSERRLKMSQTIIKEIKDLKKVILAGDFNLQPTTQTIQNIEKHLVNVFKGDLATTFNMKHKTNPGYATAVVDMIFTSPSIKIIEKSCSQADVSDHLPLLCTIDIS